jgi:hypothetical protein
MNGQETIPNGVYLSVKLLRLLFSGQNCVKSKIVVILGLFMDQSNGQLTME